MPQRCSRNARWGRVVQVEDFFRRQARRAAGLGLLTLALGAGTGHAAGCLYPDYCIKLGISGWETCQRFANATGTTAEGEEVMLSADFDPLDGCACLRDGEVSILMSEDPDTPGQAELYEELETAARQACLDRALEQGMVDSNCLSADIEGEVDVTQQPCTAGCVYSNPPPNGRCPECVVDGENASGETGASTSTTGSEEGGESGDDPPARVQLFHGGTP